MAQINKPTDYFNTVLYTGNGQGSGALTGQSITGVGFAPDMVWVKGRSGATDHNIYDRVRGDTKFIEPNTTGAEVTSANTLGLDSDGFSVGDHGEVNTNSATYAAWNWLAGGTASSNTDGSITSSVSANTTSGFSIVAWTGDGSASATVGHGLDATPAVIILKSRASTTQNWNVYHHKNTSAPETETLSLNNTDATSDNDTKWNDTAPTSSVFSIGVSSGVNNSGDGFVAYCFAEKKGFSKFGSYTGNGNADGTFVYTGMRPAMVITKRTDSVSDWRIWDNKRDTYNVVDGILYPSANNGEGTETFGDFLSNGFKIRTSGSDYNASGGSFIYMAFAESPLVGSNNIPACAR